MESRLVFNSSRFLFILFYIFFGLNRISTLFKPVIGCPLYLGYIALDRHKQVYLIFQEVISIILYDQEVILSGKAVYFSFTF